MSSSLAALEEGDQQGSAGGSAQYEDVKISIEESSEFDMLNHNAADTNPVSPGSKSSSPPVEVIVVSEYDEDEYEYDHTQSNVTLMDEDMQFDPALEFPFPKNYHEGWYELFGRTLSYMFTRRFPLLFQSLASSALLTLCASTQMTT
jgi:hypothetical protein